MKHSILTAAIFIVLFGCIKAQKPLKIEKDTLLQNTKTWDGTDLPPYPAGKPELTLLKVTVPPHTRLNWHSHPVINAGYMLKGSLTVTSENGDILELKEGDSIVELVNTLHYGENKTNKAAEILVFYVGVKNKAITVQDSLTNMDATK